MSVDVGINAARAVLKALEGRAGIIGAYLIGSSNRPYADANGDVDVGIVVEEAQLPGLLPDIKALRSRFANQKVDLSYWLDTLMASPVSDVDRFRLAHCRIIEDPTGAIAAAKARFASVPEDVRQARVRLHYFHGGHMAHLVVKGDARGDQRVVSLMTGLFVMETAKLLFIERGSWPSPASWMRQELELLDVPLAASLWPLLDAPASNSIRLFRRKLDRYLQDRGMTFVADPMALLDWYYGSEEGKRARQQWTAPDYPC